MPSTRRLHLDAGQVLWRRAAGCGPPGGGFYWWEKGTGVIDEICALLIRQMPSYQVRYIAKLGEGLDNAAYEVNGELIIRASKETNPASRSESTQREADLLAVVAELSTLPVPEPVFADIEAGVLAYFKLSGVPLMEHPVAEPARLAPALSGFLSRLHRAPLKELEHLVERDTPPLSAWQEDAEGDYLQIVEHLPAADRSLVEDFLGRTPPAQTRAAAFCHNDLGAEHVLVDVEANAVTGIIDWTDAAIADPARDLALIYRDLGPEILDLTLTYYEGQFDEADRERAIFYARCKLLEDIAYGLRTGARLYAEAGLAHLSRTFA
jgi:aminoglycoside phosphotransferase (APT) family kinase protein